MSKKLFFLILSLFFVLPFSALAQLHSYGPDLSIFTIIDATIRSSWIIFAAIAVVCFLVSGVIFLTAQGAPEKIKTARSAFIWGVAGVVVGIISYSILSVVGSLFGL